MMLEAQEQLWNRIKDFRVDDGPVSLSFIARLARENAWSRNYATRVFEEYKRFAFLTMVSGHPCTPSDQVDQAWHLHLTYTRSYWEHFCGQVLPRPLHHDPTKGGTKENEKYDDWYAKTLESYQRIFGSRPPQDIWPSSQVRFGEDLHYVRVNTKRNWIVPKYNAKKSALWLSLLAPVGLITAGCMAQIESVAQSGIMIVGGVILLLIIIGLATNSRKRGSAGDSNQGGCGTGGDYISSGGHSGHGHGSDGGHGGHGGDGHGGDGGGHGGDGSDGGGGGEGGCSGGGCSGGGGCGGGGCGGGF